MTLRPLHSTITSSSSSSSSRLILTFGLLLTLATFLAPVAATENKTLAPSCFSLPASSVCAGFYPPGASISVGPTFNCTEDAESSLKSGPLMWSSLNILTSSIPSSTCSRDFAQLMCLAVYRPCGRSISQEFCQATLGSTNSTTSSSTSSSSSTLIVGSCPLQVQGFLSTVIPNFNTIFNCTTSTLFSPEPTGVGVQLPQNDHEHPIMVPTDQCQPLAPTSICRGVIDYPIYVPWSLQGQQSHIESQIVKSFTSIMILSNVASGCLESMSKLLCSQVYTRCDTNVLSASLMSYIPPNDPMASVLPALQIPFPRLPCRGLCQQVQEQCQDLLAAQPALQSLTNCTGSGSILTPQKTCGGVDVPNTAGANFPVTSSVLASVQLGPYTIPLTSQCHSFNGTSSLLPMSASSLSSVFACPSPLVPSSRIDDPNAILSGSCATPCESLMFTQEERLVSERLYNGLIITSFCLTVFLWLTWIVFPIKRKQVASLMFSSCVLAISFAGLVSIFYTHGNTTRINCKNDSEPYKQGDGGICIFSGLINVYFTLAGAIFWNACAFDLFLKIVLQKKIDMLFQQKLNKMYLLVGWCAPWISVIIGLATNSFGSDGGISSYCVLADSSSKTTGLDWIVFYFPLMILIFAGSCCMISIMVKVGASARATGIHGIAVLKTQIRPVLFVTIFIIIFTFILSFRASLYFNKASYQKSAEEWVQCIISTLGDKDQCGETPPVRLNLALLYGIQLVVSAQGILNTLIFGTSHQNYVLWHGLLTGKGNNWKGDVTTESTLTKMTNSAGVSGGKNSNGQNSSGKKAQQHLHARNSISSHPLGGAQTAGGVRQTRPSLTGSAAAAFAKSIISQQEKGGVHHDGQKVLSESDYISAPSATMSDERGTAVSIEMLSPQQRQSLPSPSVASSTDSPVDLAGHAHPSSPSLLPNDDSTQGQHVEVMQERIVGAVTEERVSVSIEEVKQQ